MSLAWSWLVAGIATAQLVQRQYAEPELVVALEYQHDLVAKAYALSAQHVGGAVGLAGYVGEREVAHLAGGMHPQQRAVIGALAAQPVHHVEREVEPLGHLELEVAQKILIR